MNDRIWFHGTDRKGYESIKKERVRDWFLYNPRFTGGTYYGW